MRAASRPGRPGPRLDEAGRPDRRAEAALQPPPAHPRGRRRGPGEAARVEGAVDRRRRPWLAGARSTSRPRAWARSASSTSTSSTSRTSSARSSTPPTAWARRRSSSARRRSTRSTRTSRSSPTRRCSPTTTSTGSSPATTSILDGTDTFETRYTLNDAAVARGIPVVHASVFRFEGQLTAFVPYEGPCYRCLYPTPPPPELAPGCSVAGVLGVVPGMMGLLQATEALKVLLGIGEPLVGRLLIYDALETDVHRAAAAPRPACPVCGRRARRARGRTPLAVASFSDGVLHARCRAASVARVDARSGSRRCCVRTVGGPEAGRGRAARRSVRCSTRSSAPIPALRDQLFTADGELNRFVNVYVNGQDVRYSSGSCDAGRRGGRGPAAAGHGGRRGAARPIAPAAAVATPEAPPRGGATRRSSMRSATRRWSRSRGCRPNPGVRLLRQAGVRQPDRVGEGPGRRSTSSRTSSGAACSARTRSSSSRPAATRASRWR